MGKIIKFPKKNKNNLVKFPKKTRKRPKDLPPPPVPPANYMPIPEEKMDTPIEKLDIFGVFIYGLLAGVIILCVVIYVVLLLKIVLGVIS